MRLREWKKIVRLEERMSKLVMAARDPIQRQREHEKEIKIRDDIKYHVE